MESFLWVRSLVQNRPLAEAFQGAVEPPCSICLKQNEIVAAKVADHVEPHRGDPQKFWLGQLQSLCWAHHSDTKQQIEKRGYATDIGVDGYPIDPNHPVNQRS